MLSEVCLSIKLADPTTLMEAFWEITVLHPLDYMHERAHFHSYLE